MVTNCIVLVTQSCTVGHFSNDNIGSILPLKEEVVQLSWRQLKHITDYFVLDYHVKLF